ncbi:MAG: ATP-binding protein [Kiritimatiellia bacterium]
MSTSASPADRLQQHLFFTLFPPEAVRILALAATITTCKAEDVLFREGDDSDSLYLVLDGSVRIFKAMPSDPPHLLTRVEANGFFGEYGVLDGSVRSATAVAAVDTLLARIPRETLMHALQSMPGSHLLGLLHHILNGVRASNERYVQELVMRMRMSVLGESLNTIIHDFRNPMAVINMAAGMMRLQLRDSSTIAATCVTIEEQITRMNSMAEDVLDFSRGVVRLERVPTQASDLVEHFDRLNRSFLQQSGVDFQIETTEAWFLADTQKLLRVLQNLVNNAAEMLTDGNGRIRVRVTAEADTLVIAVSDNGPGIPEAVRTRLFEPFATAGKARGIGLGLAIVKAIVASHQGTIQVETATGKGTTFQLRFPRCQPDGTPCTGAV